MSQHHATKNLSGIDAFCHLGCEGSAGDRFRRMCDFPSLFTPVEALRAMGEKGGVMDGGANANRTAAIPVGMVLFGQFIDHDITLVDRQ